MYEFIAWIIFKTLTEIIYTTVITVPAVPAVPALESSLSWLSGRDDRGGLETEVAVIIRPLPAVPLLEIPQIASRPDIWDISTLYVETAQGSSRETSSLSDITEDPTISPVNTTPKQRDYISNESDGQPKDDPSVDFFFGLYIH